MSPINALSVMIKDPPALAGEKSVMELGAVNWTVLPNPIQTRPAKHSIVFPTLVGSMDSRNPKVKAAAPSELSATLSVNVVVVLSEICATKYHVLGSDALER